MEPFAIMSLIHNAILVAVTACLVAFLPGYFQKVPPIIIHGEVVKGFEPVLAKFRYELNICKLSDLNLEVWS